MSARAVAMVGIVVTGIATAYVVALLLGMPDPAWGGWGRLVLHLGELAVLVALALGGAAGRGPLGRIGVGVAGLGLVLLAVAEPSVVDLLFTIAPNLVGIGMLLVGVAVLRAGVWTGWQRWLPLAQGVALFAVLTPLIIVSGGPPETLGLVGLLVWEVLWVLIGVSAAGAWQRGPAPRAAARAEA